MAAIILIMALIFMCATLSQAEFSPKFQIEIKGILSLATFIMSCILIFLLLF